MKIQLTPLQHAQAEMLLNIFYNMEIWPVNFAAFVREHRFQYGGKRNLEKVLNFLAERKDIRFTAVRDGIVFRPKFICPDCGTREGKVHKTFDCPYERCPFCRKPVFECDCIYEQLGLIDKTKYTAETKFMEPEVYRKGLSDEQYDHWFNLMERKGRIPFNSEPWR